MPSLGVVVVCSHGDGRDITVRTAMKASENTTTVLTAFIANAVEHGLSTRQVVNRIHTLEDDIRAAAPPARKISPDRQSAGIAKTPYELYLRVSRS